MAWDRRELAQGLWLVFLHINEWKRERVPDSRDSLGKYLGRYCRYCR
jgi:glycyl-tRNA synthetase (class II)